MPLGPGSRLDAYEIVRPLGAGGMGEVWLATELRLGRKVALKLLPADLTRDPSRVQRFEQEARAASALSHPNVCHIYALGQTEEGQHYIAMELVEGETLRRRLSSTRLSIREALNIAIQVAAALSAAHAAGIVHRDIKPENIMLRPDGFVKVLDFGLAKLAPAPTLDATETAFRTEAGAVVGTLAYMSPEQARGQQVDARTDIWSLGVVLYEMLAGRSPFATSSSSEMVAAILEREPPPIARFEPEVPFELQRIVTKAIRKERAQRYQVAHDLLLDLQSLRDEPQVRATAESAPRALQPAEIDRTGARTRAKRLIALGVTICIVGVLGIWWWVTWSRPGSGAKSATAQRNLVRLTFDPGLQTEPTWSPDGRSIAYASDRAGNFDIWAQAVAGGEPVQLTRSPAQDTAPNWSPDGRRIVFRSERNGGGLFVIPAVGGPERQLTTFGLHPEWVRDGSEILFRAGLGGTGWVHLYAVSAEGGEEPREILRGFIRNGDWDWIASHPDGRVSALGRHAQSGPGFFTLSRDGRSVTRSELDPALPLPLQEGRRSGPGTRVLRFAWNIKGTALYVEAVVNEVQNIWRVNIDPKTLKWQSADRLTGGAGADVGTALSRDGTRLVFTTERNVSRLWAFPFDAAAGRLIADGKPITPEDATVEGSALSPDGERALYTLRRAGSRAVDLWVVQIQSAERELLAQNVVSACWSADGRSIAYTLFRADPGEWVVAARPLAGPERLLGRWTRDSALLVSDWTADDSAILGSYFSPFSSPATLVLWPSSTPASKPQRVVLAAPPRHLFQGKFSPDGRWISFVAAQQGDTRGIELMIAPATGAPPSSWTRIAADHAWPDKPRWAPDGKTLYFLSRQAGAFFNLWAVRFDLGRGRPTGPPFKVTSFDSPGFRISQRISDTEMDIVAKRALLTFETVSGSIWMLDNVEK